MDETWKRSCQLLPSSEGFPRDKSQDMECMMNKFTYSTFRMAGGKKTAGRDLSHNLSFFIIFKIIYLFSQNSSFLLQHIKGEFSFLVFLWTKYLIIYKLKPLFSLGRRARSAYGIGRWSEGLRVILGVFSAVFLNHCCSLMWIIKTNHSRRLWL